MDLVLQSCLNIERHLTEKSKKLKDHWCNETSELSSAIASILTTVISYFKCPTHSVLHQMVGGMTFHFHVDSVKQVQYQTAAVIIGPW